MLPNCRQPGNAMNAWTRHLGPWALLGLVCLVIFMQFFSRGLRGRTLMEAPEEERAVEVAEPPGVGPLTVKCKMIIAMRLRKGEDEEFEEDVGDDQVQQMQDLAVSRAERVRLGVMVGEIQGAADAAEYFKLLAQEATPGGEVAADSLALQRYYDAQAKVDVAALNPGNASTPPAARPVLDDSARLGLEQRHGWFALVAETYGRDASDPQRAWLARSGRSVFSIFAIRGLLEVLFLVLGLALLGITIKKSRDEGFEPEMYVTSVPGEVYLESVLVFFLGFAMFMGVRVLLLGQTESWAIIVAEVLAWSLLLSVAWPLLRGVTTGELALDLGLERGQGFGTEVLIGVAGFLVAAPVELLVGILGAILEHALFGDAKQSAGVAMFRQPMTESWWPWVFSALGALVWAPFVEECIFRGALHRWLPAKLGPVLRVIISATLFGAAHPYSLAGLLSVGASGLVFGGLREWRGSLIAPMTAHFLKNASIVGFELVMLQTLG